MYKQDLVISLGKLEDFKLQAMVKFPSLRGIGLSAVIMKEKWRGPVGTGQSCTPRLTQAYPACVSRSKCAM